MAIGVICQHCGRQVAVAQQHAGKSFPCPDCQRLLKVPEIDDASKVVAVCGSCHKNLRVPARLLGKQVKCPLCGQATVLSAPQPAPAKPPVAKPPPPPPRRAAPPSDAWHVHRYNGEQYGPITKVELDQWVAESLISSSCQLRQGDGPWRLASEFYQHLPVIEGSPTGRTLFPEGYSPILTPLASKASMASTYIQSSLAAIGRGNQITHSKLFQYGEARSMWELVKAGTFIGPMPKRMAMRVDQLHWMTLSDPAGEFHVLAPFDNGAVCPVQFLSVVPAHLPTSLALVRGEGGERTSETMNALAAAFVPTVARVAIRELHTQAAGVWTVLDADESSHFGTVANQFPELLTNLRFDATVGMGQREITYHLNWLAQALPLGPQKYLLVAQYIPASVALGMLGFDFGVAWFVRWRDQFTAMASQLPAGGKGRFCCCDYGNWGVAAYEALSLDIF